MAKAPTWAASSTDLNLLGDAAVATEHSIDATRKGRPHRGTLTSILAPRDSERLAALSGWRPQRAQHSTKKLDSGFSTLDQPG